MSINRTTLGESLLRTYDVSTINRMQNLESPVWSAIPGGRNYTTQGDGLYFGVKASGDEGFGFMDEDGALPASQNEQNVQARVRPKVFVGTVKVTGLSRAIGSGAGAFKNVVQDAFDSKLARMTAYLEGALFRDGTGKLAQFQGAPGDTTSAVTIDTPGAAFFRRNMMVEVLDDATGAKLAGPVKVTSVDKVNSTITLASDISALVGDNDGIYLAGTQPQSGGPVEREIAGLDAAIATSGTYLNIARSAIEEWQGNVVNAASTDLDEDLLLRAEQRIEEIGGKSPAQTVVIMSPSQRRKYFALVQAQKQFTGLSLDAGYTDLTWSGRRMLSSYLCPNSTVYMGDLSELQKFYAPDGEMHLDTTGGDVLKWAQGFDAAVAFYKSYCETVVRKPNAWARITNLNVPAF